MTGFARFLPLLALLALIALFYSMMGDDRNPQEIKSVLVGRQVPAFTLPVLNEAGVSGADGQKTEAALITGKPLLVNFFASWCAPCRAEHDNLIRLSNEYGLRVVGIAYKDDPAKSQAFLDELGNPYSLTLIDRDGRSAIDWGVSGVPESFLVDARGTIVYRHWGPIIGNGLEQRLLPKLMELRK